MPICCFNRIKRYALGAPVVGSTNVVYALDACLPCLVRSDVFMLVSPVSTDSTLPPLIQLKTGQVLPVVFSSTAGEPEASAITGTAAYLATILTVNGVTTLNILNAMNNPATAAASASSSSSQDTGA